MYWFSRRHFSEGSARIAFLCGLFWYELVGFAHKPMSECLATGALMCLLAICVQRDVAHRKMLLLAASALFVLLVAVRMQYLPVALIVMGIVLLRAGPKWPVAAGCSLLLTLCVGVFDAVSWDGGVFHSYIVNAGYNFYIVNLLSFTFPVWQYLGWMGIASGGLFTLVVPFACVAARRYQLLLLLLFTIVLVHGLQAHKEYRFVFAAIPIWLLLGSDLGYRVFIFTGIRSCQAPDVILFVGGPVYVCLGCRPVECPAEAVAGLYQFTRSGLASCSVPDRSSARVRCILVPV